MNENENENELSFLSDPDPHIAGERDFFWFNVRMADDVFAKFERYTERGESDECWSWKNAPSKRGIGQFVAGAWGLIDSHRYAWEAEFGPIPFGNKVIVTCSTRHCVNPAHLRCLTNDEFTEYRKPMQARGAANGRTKLTEEAVYAIRRAFDLGASPSSLAELWSVSPRTITKIGARENWAHLEERMYPEDAMGVPVRSKSGTSKGHPLSEKWEKWR